MLPPFCALVAVENAWPRAGATPKQPIIGWSGGANASRPFDGSRSRTVPAIAVDIPDSALLRRPLGNRGRVQHGEGEGRIGPTGRPARRQPVDVDGQRVTRLGTFDEEWPGHRVWPLADGNLAGIKTGRVDRIGHHRVAVGDAKARLRLSL